MSPLRWTVAAPRVAMPPARSTANHPLISTAPSLWRIAGAYNPWLLGSIPLGYRRCFLLPSQFIHLPPSRTFVSCNGAEFSWGKCTFERLAPHQCCRTHSSETGLVFVTSGYLCTVIITHCFFMLYLPRLYRTLLSFFLCSHMIRNTLA